MNRNRTALIVFSAVVASGLGACKARDNAADSVALRTDSAGGRVDSAARANANAATNATPNATTDSARRADSAHATRNGWSEPSILGFTWAANNGEIQMGQLGAKKATNAKV